MKVAVLGGGAFGSAMAIHFAKKGYNVFIWEFFKEIADSMQDQRESVALKGFKFSDNVTITSNIIEAVENSDLVFLSVPSDKVESTLESIKFDVLNAKIIIGSKGFAKNLEPLTLAAKRILKNNPIYYLSGPTIAKEIAEEKISAMVLAFKEHDHSTAKLIESNYLKVETSTDIIGCQLGAALKNAVNIFVGISEGLNLGENTKAYLFTKGISDIAEVGLAMGAKKETFMGLTCMGDLTLNSRNRQVGVQIAQGQSIESIQKEAGHVIEGILALENAKKLATKFHRKVPVIDALYNIVFKKEDILEAIKEI